ITLDNLGVAYSLMGELAKALGYHQQALERQRAAESRRYEAIALGNIGHVYTLMGEAQKAIDFHRQALTLFRTLGDRQNEAKMLNEAHVDIRQGVGSDLIAKERDLNQLLNAKAQRQIQLKGQKGSAQQIATLDKEISTLEDEYQQVQGAIRKASPAYAALTQP